MTPEQKQQAKQLIADWTNVSKTSTPAVWFLNGDCMAGFLQELVDVDDKFKANVIAAINAAAPNARHVEVDGQPVFFSRSGDDITDTHTLTPCPHCGGSGAAEDCAPEPEPFGYFKSEPFGWTDCAETDDGAIALYTAPPAPSVPDVANTFKRRAEEIVAMAMNRDNYAETNRLSAALIMDIANAAEATTQAEAPADVARDARLQVESEFAALLPGVTYMDEPDGGTISVQEQVKRMAMDAARYRWLRNENAKLGSGYYVGNDTNTMPGDITWIGSDLDAAIDAAIEREKGGAK